MQEIFDQLGSLFLGAVPTIILFIVMVLAYQFLVQGPLTAILAERRARTVGAVEAAQKAISEAEAKAAEYADRLRQARAEAYKAREKREQQLNAERDAALETARHAAGRTVSEAKAQIDQESDAARQTIQSSVSDLAGRVIRAVLPATAGGTR